MVMDYYAYWNGGQIRDLFEALVSICSGSSYEGLLKTAVLAGFLVTLTGALLKWQGLASKVYLFAAVLFYSVMLVPKVDVAIHDERSADVYVVSNVPFGVGFFAAATSKIGHFLTESFETAFSLPDAERFSKFGLVYPQRALNSLLAAGPVTPEGRALTDRVIADCIEPNSWNIRIKPQNSAAPETFGPRFPQTAGSIRRALPFLPTVLSKDAIKRSRVWISISIPLNSTSYPGASEPFWYPKELIPQTSFGTRFRKAKHFCLVSLVPWNRASSIPSCSPRSLAAWHPLPHKPALLWISRQNIPLLRPI